MSYKTFRMWQAIMGVFIGGTVGASVAAGNWFIPIPVIIIAMVVLYILRGRIKEVYTDERTYTIAYKAARLTVGISTIGMALLGAVFLAASHGNSSELSQIGFTLEYATCALLVINYIAYYFYSRRLGGR